MLAWSALCAGGEKSSEKGNILLSLAPKQRGASPSKSQKVYHATEKSSVHCTTVHVLQMATPVTVDKPS